MGAVKNAFHDEIERRRVAEEIGVPCEWLEMTLDNWTGDYRDHYNNLFVTRGLGRKLWTVASRGPGNITIQHSRHRELNHALGAAESILVERYA